MARGPRPERLGEPRFFEERNRSFSDLLGLQQDATFTLKGSIVGSIEQNYKEQHSIKVHTGSFARGGSRYVEGCWGSPYLKIKRFLGCWFLGFLVSWFFGFKDSWFLGFKKSFNAFKRYKYHMTNFQFHFLDRY